LGVAPSAWDAAGAGGPVLQIKRGLLFGADSETRLIHNAYYGTGDFRYIATSVAATNYQQASGQHRWYNAPSGTAGNTITWTQAMTLDARGNLGVGSTNPSVTGYGKAVRLQGSGNAAYEVTDGTVTTVLLATGGASGVVRTDSNHPLVFGTNGTERARIDSSGNFFVGATALTSDANYFAYSPGNTFADFGHSSGVASTTPYTRFLYAAGVIGSITQAGTTGVLYNITSDQRLKENIQDADSASSLIDSLQVRKFDWKADGNHQRYGFIAQELVTVAPEAVHQPADTEEMMAVDYSKLVPMLVKEIQSLRQRLSAANL
jgi:hypothetical protein